jgi:hypothetical protein
MQYFRNTNQIQTVGLNKPIGGREECYYGFVTNGYAVSPNLTNPNQPCNNVSQVVTWPYFPCDNPTEQLIQVASSNTSNGYASIGCVSANRFGPPSPAGPTNREPQMLFSPFTCETQFSQSMTEYEYVTFTALGFGSPYITGSALGNDSFPFGLASYIPSGSTQYEYKVIQLIPNCTYPPDSDFYAPGTPLWGPIAIVSGSAYYSTTYAYPKGNEPVNPTSQNMYFSPYP